MSSPCPYTTTQLGTGASVGESGNTGNSRVLVKHGEAAASTPPLVTTTLQTPASIGKGLHLPWN